VVAGEGGKGTVWIADVEIEDCSPAEAPTATASSALPDFAAPAALHGSGWKPRPDDPSPWIVIDSIEPRAMGGLIVDWLEHAPASGFRVRGSNSGVRWKNPVHRNGGRAAKRSYVYLPGLKTRFFFAWSSTSHRRGAASEGAIVRVLAFHPCLLEQRRERRSARLASALAAQ